MKAFTLIVTVSILAALTKSAPAPPTEIKECSKNLTETKLYQDPTSCHKYFQCSNGTKVEMECPGGQQFNNVLGVCDNPKYANCKLLSNDTNSNVNNTTSERTTIPDDIVPAQHSTNNNETTTIPSDIVPVQNGSDSATSFNDATNSTTISSDHRRENNTSDSSSDNKSTTEINNTTIKSENNSTASQNVLKTTPNTEESTVTTQKNTESTMSENGGSTHLPRKDDKGKRRAEDSSNDANASSEASSEKPTELNKDLSTETSHHSNDETSVTPTHLPTQHNTSLSKADNRTDLKANVTGELTVHDEETEHSNKTKQIEEEENGESPQESNEQKTETDDNEKHNKGEKPAISIGETETKKNLLTDTTAGITTANLKFEKKVGSRKEEYPTTSDVVEPRTGKKSNERDEQKEEDKPKDKDISRETPQVELGGEEERSHGTKH